MYFKHISLVLAILFVGFGANLSAQSSVISTTHDLTFKSQFFQIKDEFNYGLVFHGLNLALDYSYERTFEQAQFSYNPELSFGANYNKGVGFAWGFIPINLFYGFKINNGSTTQLFIGPYFATHYNWQLYPELQSGHMFWFTTIEIGPEVTFSLPAGKRVLKITASNSLAGFTSRPEPSTETYYYSLSLGDFISNAHQNMQFASLGLFNHTDLSIDIFTQKNFSLGYQFRYFGYYQEPRYGYIAHSINFNWILSHHE